VEELRKYIEDPSRIITIILPRLKAVYEEGELEQLHMQALQALKAA
jgi:hypothetical protein